jgi:phosphoribosyl 1,2-cyclic phosphate phosphodiesterase
MPTDDDARAADAPALGDEAPATGEAPPLTVTLLGTGTSTGVPVLGCTCPVCRSDDPRDRRTRCACHVRIGPAAAGASGADDDDPDAPALHLQIDTGPDFRAQALREGLTRVDAVCYTHHHFDHIAGLDDLRPFFFRHRAPMPCYGLPATNEVLRTRHDYIFGDDRYPGAPRLRLHDVEEAPFALASRYDDRAAPVTVTPVPLWHGDMPVLGFRIGRFAYLTDVSHIPEASFERLRGVDTLVLDALRPEPHPTHLSFDDGVAAARRIGARQTYFIHMTHSVFHAEQDAALPDGIHLGYDGLSFTVE